MSSLFITRRIRILHPHLQLQPAASHRLVCSTALQGMLSRSLEGGRDDLSEPVLPMVPKRRDPDAVLKALASTVEPVESPLYMGGRNIADPLYPRGRIIHMNYIQHYEAGRGAARYIIQRWSKMFPDRKPDTLQKRPKLSGRSLLERLISEREASKAWSVYLAMRRMGKRVPQTVLNELLALIAYEGLGNPLASGPDTSDNFVQWLPISKQKTAAANSDIDKVAAAVTIDSGKETKVDSKEKKLAVEPDAAAPGEITETTKQSTSESLSQTNKVRIWSVTNIPEVMFARMKKKDGQTYEALIQGLIKFDRYGRAFEIFQEMRAQGFQANVGTYNLLLSTLKANHVFNIAKSLVEQMNKEPVVQPDITTMNHLMRVSSKVGGASKAMTLKTMREIFHLGLEPTLTSFVYLLIATSSERYGVATQDKQEILQQVVEYLENNKQLLVLQERIDMIFFIQAFTIAKDIGSADLAMRLKELADTNHYFLIDNLNLVMSKYLSTLVFDAPFETTMTEYKKLVPKMFVPLEWLYREMFRICDEQRSVEDALKLWKDIQRFRVPIYKEETLNNFCGAISHPVPQEYILMYIHALEQVWKHFGDLKLKPSGILITAMVCVHASNNNLEEAWRYCGYFPQNPSFVALMALLEKHNSLGNKQKIVEILEMMMNLKMDVSLRFVKGILSSTEIEQGTRRRLLAGFTSNRTGNQVESQETNLNSTFQKVNVDKQWNTTSSGTTSTSLQKRKDISPFDSS